MHPVQLDSYTAVATLETHVHVTWSQVLCKERSLAQSKCTGKAAARMQEHGVEEPRCPSSWADLHTDLLQLLPCPLPDNEVGRRRSVRRADGQN